MLKRMMGGMMLLLLAAPALAQHNDPIEEHFIPPELVMQHQRDLGLSEDQKGAIKEAVQTAQATFTDVQWELQDEMETLEDLVKKTKVDEARVLDQLEKILGLEREIKRAQLTLMVRIKNALTPEQQEKLWMVARFSDEGSERDPWLW